MTNDEVVQAYFAAMRRGTDAARDLFALFADDAVYIEPFTGEGAAIGIEAIRRRFQLGWATPLPDMELEVLALEVDGRTARSLWECRSPGLPGPVRGEDRYEFAAGRISRLEVTVEPIEEPEEP